MDDFEDDVCSRLSTSFSLMFCWKEELENLNEQNKRRKAQSDVGDFYHKLRAKEK